MKKQGKINIFQTNLRLRLMAGAKGFQVVEIPEIPSHWVNFPKSEDEWCGIEMPNSENSTACLYKAKANSCFDPHEHRENIEHLVIMNSGGCMKILVEGYGTYVLEYPNSMAIPKNVVHAVEFMTDTVIMCVWHPKFKKGWEAKFKEEEK